MYNELLRCLREHAKPWNCADNCICRDAVKRGYGSCSDELAKLAADAIEELSKKYLASEVDNTNLTGWLAEEHAKHLWIPVTERLPEAGDRVLCYCRANIYEVMKMRTDGDWVYDTNHIYMHSFVTHWMPLPEPPKEEA